MSAFFQGDLLASLGGIACRGDGFAEDLRIARSREERTYLELRAAVRKLVGFGGRYRLGVYVEDVVDDLDTMIEADDSSDLSLDHRWHRLRAENILECVLEARDDPDDAGVPEEAVIPAVRALGNALQEYSQALLGVATAERMSAQNWFSR